MVQLKRARPTTLQRFYYLHGSRSEMRIEQRLAIAAQSLPLTTLPSVVEPAALLVTHLVKMIESVVAAIKEFDRHIAALFPKCPDAALFAGLPGAGLVMAPRLLCAFGNNRERFGNASEIQRYSGIAPVTRQNGKSRSVKHRRRCPKFLKQSFHEFAGSSISYSPWANTYYQAQRQRGLSHQSAVRALAYKWQRVIFACWKKRVDYDEQYHCQDLIKYQSPHAPDRCRLPENPSQTS
jgi:transposase